MTGKSRWLSGIPKSKKEGKRESKAVRRTVEGYVFSAQMGRRRKVSCTASQLYLCSLWRAGLSLQSTKVDRGTLLTLLLLRMMCAICHSRAERISTYLFRLFTSKTAVSWFNRFNMVQHDFTARSEIALLF